MSRDLSEDDVLMVMDFGFGPEATTFSSSRPISLCAPCWEHDGRHRRAAWTGQRELDFTAPNLCSTHLVAFREGRSWDRGLQGAGRPRVNDGGCAVSGCRVESFARGLCKRHYQRKARAARRKAKAPTDTTRDEFALPL